MAKVVLTAEGQRHLAHLPGGMIRRVNAILERLEDWPQVSGAKPLRRELVGCHRIRTGDWRILFRVTGDVVTVFAIDNRRDVYER